MKHCPNCGHGNEDGSIYCMLCGASMRPVVRQPTPGPVPRYPVPAPVPVRIRQTDGMAVCSLILGILSFVSCWLLFGVLAIALGSMSLRKIEEGAGSVGGESYARIGMILGWINVAISLAVALLFLALVIVGVTWPWH